MTDEKLDVLPGNDEGKAVSLETLQSFCAGKGDPRHYLRHPNTVGEFTYATNGHILVRVPKIPLPNYDVFRLPDFEEVIDHSVTEFSPLVLPPEPDWPPCYACEGEQQKVVCPRCNGTKIEKIVSRVAVGRAHIDWKLLAQIAALPNAEIATPTNAEAGVRFRFDGGIGVVMPLRQ